MQGARRSLRNSTRLFILNGLLPDQIPEDCPMIAIDIDAFRSAATDDKEFLYKLRGLTTTARIGPDDSAVDVEIADGRITAVRAAGGEAAAVIASPAAFCGRG